MADKGSYLAKLLTLIIKKQGGSIRIPAADLMEDDTGQGLTVNFDYSTKELVLSFFPANTQVYKIGEPVTWLNPISLPVPSSSASQPSRDELLAKIWTGSASSPTNEELASQRPKPKKPTVINLTDEDLSLAELERRKREALRELDKYQSPQPVVTPSSARTTFYKQ